MDVADRAEELVEYFSEIGIKAACAACQPQHQMVIDNVVVCRECEDPLPVQRVETGRCLCKMCQEAKERRDSLGG